MPSCIKRRFHNSSSSALPPRLASVAVLTGGLVGARAGRGDERKSGVRAGADWHATINAALDVSTACGSERHSDAKGASASASWPASTGAASAVGETTAVDEAAAVV